MRLRFLVVASLFASAACAGGARVDDGVSKATIRSMPGWFSKPPAGDEKWIFAPATATSRDVQIALNKAQAEGRAALATQLEVKYGGLTRRFAEETGLGRGAQLLDDFEQTYKAVVSQVLVGTRAKEQKFVVDDGVYRAWVLMELPIGEASKKLLEQIQAQEQLYTRIRATQAYKELNDEVERYEAARRR